MRRFRCVITTWVAVLVMTSPAVVQAWDFEFYGDDTFQNKVEGVPGDPDYSKGGCHWNWDNLKYTTGIDWEHETVVDNGGATAPLGAPKYLDRNSDTPGTALWGANVALLHGWNGPDWLENGLDSKRFTVVFRIKNMGSGKWSTDPTPVWQPRENCIFEIGSDKNSGNDKYPKDYLYAVGSVSTGASMDQGIKWVFDWNDDGERSWEGPGEQWFDAKNDFEIWRIVGQGKVKSDGREYLDIYLYNEEFPEVAAPVSWKYHYNCDGSGESFYDIKFRFSHPYPAPYEGDELHRYGVDWIVIDVGHAWKPGEGDDIPLPLAGYRRTFTIDPDRTRIAVTAVTPAGAASGITTATGDVSIYLDPDNSPISIRLDKTNLNFSDSINFFVDSGSGTMTATATDMTLDHKMWWVEAEPSPLTGGPGLQYFEWNAADSQTECIARAPGEEWNNEDDVEYTRTGWLTYQADGDICTALQGLGLPCDNLASPSDLTRTRHQIGNANLGTEGCMVNLSSAVGMMAGGQSPEDSASLGYAFKQTWPLITDDDRIYGEMIIDAKIVATSGDNPPSLPPFPSDPPDYDGDGDVDLEDYAHFEDCATGPEMGPVALDCEDADLDQDGDVDQVDFGVFQRCISGDGNNLDPDCVK